MAGDPLLWRVSGIKKPSIARGFRSSTPKGLTYFFDFLVVFFFAAFLVAFFAAFFVAFFFAMSRSS